MSRGTDYLFIPTDPEDIIIWLTSLYEEIMHVTVHPGSPERNFIQWVSDAIVLERVMANYAANQNIPSRAVGRNLDALAELTYIKERPPAKAAVCTMRFTISEPQAFAVLVPKGTRVTDARKTLVWATLEDAYVNAGEMYADVAVQCQKPGTVGNGYVKGQINSIIDPFAYLLSCENVTVTGGGSDVPDDNTYYELMRESMDAYSDAGAEGGYVYFAKQVSTEIADVAANSPIPGEVWIYTLMKDGTLAGDEVKAKVLDACTPKWVRPLSDHVFTKDAELVEYDIDFTYYLTNGSPQSAAKTAEKVQAAVAEYIAWQSAKLGRDVNPSKLYHLLMETGIKRVDIRSPVFTRLRDGNLMLGDYMEYDSSQAIPQVAKLRRRAVTDGGYEDE